ncbi:leucine-rich repeat domain-containing protein [Chryseobacterium takakiae]|uniref:Leucine rich repeat-containing protein n=1 Tax=Chryseobacterium takakiae TaxID=1302685 RepID=A0A1M4UV32_9FLAO|nr:leucine-rich repeat domain-containing protein [Chryseobacterium takakiae]SHE60535.1 Leucine rich repeat-containing protein [Chryseobacterium takakiae]
MKTYILLFIFLCMSILSKGFSQNKTTAQDTETYTSIQEALRNPEKVKRLDLSNQKIDFPKGFWSKFKNLEYLSLKNEGLMFLPEGISELKSLKVLDVSGNDFKVLPSGFTKLTKLEELFLNDEKNIDLSRNIDLISKMKNLKVLHIENDGLKKLPPNFWKLNYLEAVYLNDNELKEFDFPKQKINNLKNIYLNNNLFMPSDIDRLNTQYGTLLRF